MKPGPPYKVPEDIELVVFDVDGVLTDGRIWLSDEGSESKSFHTQDGFGIRRLLQAGLQVGVISGRQSNAAQKRMSELGVRHVLLGCDDKLDAFVNLTGKLGIAIEKTAYVGDDVPDIPVLRVAGFGFAVANAVEEVKAECALITALTGGHGAVREICDLLLAARNRD